ncbi:restriction endonuclease subunit S [Acinetobacter lwoffii]|uniref:restriction endonuclease subunit S n=2 Tax=Acinetobacter TaxID=469 RepID=UPI00209A7A33|nr:restriction endonuclease subunit S [Acinetobacter lwoffii]MCO8093255.1 restriction endonuclease subunit S [Acinetobacter lwoffii]
MAKYQKYAEYKDSGVEWLGAIPGHWGVTQLKRLGKFITGMTPSTAVEAYYSDEITEYGWIRPEDILEESEKVEPTKFLTKLGWETQRTIPAQSTLICCIGTIGKLGFLGKRAVTNQQITALVPNVRGFSKYYYYLLTASRNQLEHLATGNVVKILNSERLGSLWLPLLSSQNEARQIVHFLDHETAKIDTLIAKQEKLIELLKEKRQAVISHAVTKGLNPNVPMKDSGVEWLGQVPKHWDVIAISKVTQKITNGYVGPTRDILVEEGIPYVQATHIKKGKVNFDNAYFVREKWSNDHAKSILKKDDVLIVQTGAGTGDVGLVSESEEGFNCHALIILQPKKQQLSGSYLAYCLQSDYGYATLYSIRTGGMHPHLNCGEVQFVKISVPPLDEQVAISKFIEKNIQDFDQLIEKAKLAIQLMQERRTALISSAVTGKIDVRHHASRPSGNDKKQKEGI